MLKFRTISLIHSGDSKRDSYTDRVLSPNPKHRRKLRLGRAKKEGTISLSLFVLFLIFKSKRQKLEL